jgi:hypothetical protein
MNRKVMMEVIKKNNEATAQKVLPFTQKSYNFWMLKKRRFFYLFALSYMYKYDYPNRLVNWVKTKKENTYKKYSTRWIAKYNPSMISYDNISKDFHIKTGQNEILLQQHNIDMLSAKILEVDFKLKKFGFSRELVSRVLRGGTLKAKYGLLIEVERNPSIVEKTSRKIKRALD